MSVNKRYYWLKLKEDFFDDDTIQFIEEQPNGKEYCLFYLKLCLKSLKTDGTLIRKVGDILIPYDIKKLAEITRTDVDTVRVAMELFKKIGLIQVLENGELFLKQLENMVGSETKDAIRKRKKRSEIKGVDNVRQLSENCPPEKEKEKEKEKDIEIEKEQDKDKDKDKKNNSCSSGDKSEFNIYLYFQQRGFVSISPMMYQDINCLIEMYSMEEVKAAVDISDQNGKHSLSYVKGILEKRRANGGDKPKEKSCSRDKGSGFNNFSGRDHTEEFNKLQELVLLGQANEEERERYYKLREEQR